MEDTDGLATTNSDTTDVDDIQNISKGRSVDEKDTNINGEAVKDNHGAFDTGIEFGSSGIGVDDVQRMEFTLSADALLTIDDFDLSLLELRVTSVGAVHGARENSLKLDSEEVTPPPPVEPGTVDAEEDFTSVQTSELSGAGESANIVDLFNFAEFPPSYSILFNDSDPEEDQFAVFSLSGGGTTATKADEQGWLA